MVALTVVALTVIVVVMGESKKKVTFGGIHTDGFGAICKMRLMKDLANDLLQI